MTDTYSKAAVGYERIQEILQTPVIVKDDRRARPAQKFNCASAINHPARGRDLCDKKWRNC